MTCNECHEVVTSMVGDLCHSCHYKNVEGHFLCKICGKAEHEKAYTNGKNLAERQLCFGCGFWSEYADDAANPRHVRVDGEHFYIGDSSPHPIHHMSGYGGRHWSIHFNDGRVVETNNLWHQGMIPDQFKDVLADNARFSND